MASIEQCPKINQGAIIALGVLCGLLFISVFILLLLLARIIEGRLDRLDSRRNRRSESDEYLGDAELDADQRHRGFLGPDGYSRDTFVAAPELVSPIRTGLGRGPIRYRSGQWRDHESMEVLRDRMRRNQLIYRRGPPVQYPGMNATNPENQAMQQPFMQGNQLPAQQGFGPPLGAQHLAQQVIMPSPRLQQAAQNNVVRPPRFQQPEQQGNTPSPRGNFMSRRNSGRNDIDSGGRRRGDEGLNSVGEGNGGLERGGLDGGRLRREARNSRAHSRSDRSMLHPTENQQGEPLDHGGSRRSDASGGSIQREDGAARNGLDVSGRSRGRARSIGLLGAKSNASSKPQGKVKGIEGSEDAR